MANGDIHPVPVGDCWANEVPDAEGAPNKAEAPGRDMALDRGEGPTSSPDAPDVVACTWLHRRGTALLAVRPYAVRRDADDPGPYFLPGGMPEPGETYAEAAAGWSDQGSAVVRARGPRGGAAASRPTPR